MSFKTKIKRFFDLEEEGYDFSEHDYPEIDEEEELPLPKKQGSKQNIVSLQSVQKSTKVILSEPRTYAEAQDIADHLKSRRAVVINLQRIEQDQAKRIVDFLSGTVYAIGGDIQKLGDKTFLCTPDNVDVAGSISEMVPEHDITDNRW